MRFWNFMIVVTFLPTSKPEVNELKENILKKITIINYRLFAWKFIGQYNKTAWYLELGKGDLWPYPKIVSLSKLIWWNPSAFNPGFTIDLCVYILSVHCKCAMKQNKGWIFNYFHFLDISRNESCEFYVRPHKGKLFSSTT